MAGTACDAPAAYRPRRARESSLYRLKETQYETFKQVYDERFAERYGASRAVVERTVFAFLNCGIEEHGFARVRCDECRREFRVALSCKRRGFCPPGLGRSTGASSRSSLRPPAVGLLRPAGSQGEAHRRRSWEHRPRTEPRAHAPPPG